MGRHQVVDEQRPHDAHPAELLDVHLPGAARATHVRGERLGSYLEGSMCNAWKKL